MYFRSTGMSDDRRRRVLNDSLLASSLVSGRGRRSASRGSRRKVRLLRSENYGDAEFLEDLPRLFELIPLRLYPFLAVLFAGVAAIAGLVTLHACLPQMEAAAPSGRLAVFDLTQAGSLGAWFSTIALALSAMLAWIVYSVRRWRIDDYRGHYRIWLWAALCWLVMSIEQTAAVRGALADLMIAVSGTRLLGDGSIWWVIVYGFLIGGVAARLLIDMRHCLVSCGALVGAAACFVVAAIMHFGGLQPGVAERGPLFQQGVVLGGNYLILLAMLCHGRHVLFDALGLIETHGRSREMLKRSAEIAEAAELLTACTRGVKIHPPHGTPRAPTTSAEPQQVTVVLAQPSQPPKATTIDTAGASVNRKLTKEERRRLRERLQRERDSRG